MKSPDIHKIEGSGIDRVMTRWPMLPLLSLPFWICWRFVAFSGTMCIGFVNHDLFFYLTMLAVCSVVMVASRFGDRLRLHPALQGGIGTAGTLLLLLSGPDHAHFFGGYGTLMGNVGSILCGIAITCIAIHSITLLGRLRPTEIWISLAYTEFVVVSIYFIILGTEGPLAMIIFAALPLCAGILASLPPMPSSPLAHHEPREDAMAVPRGTYVKFGTFIGLLSIACYIARLLTTNDVIDPFATNSLAWPALGRIILAIAALAAVVYFSQRFPFSKMCVFVAIMILAVLACMALPSFDPLWLFSLTAFAHPVLECMTLAIAACFIQKTSTRPPFVAALGLAALYGLVPIGRLLEWVLETTFPGISYTAFIVIAVICAANALVFLQDSTYETVMGPIERPQEHASRGKKRRVEQAQSLKELKGLSQREYDVLLEIQHGQSAQKIAEHMHLSVHTVRGHIQRIYVKCNVHSRDELVDLMSDLKG